MCWSIQLRFCYDTCPLISITNKFILQLVIHYAFALSVEMDHVHERSLSLAIGIGHLFSILHSKPLRISDLSLTIVLEKPVVFILTIVWIQRNRIVPESLAVNFLADLLLLLQSIRANQNQAEVH